MPIGINKELLFSHFDGRTTPLQEELLRDWLQTSESQQLYYRWLQEWERQNPQIITDPDAAFALFQQKLEVDAQPHVVHRLSGRSQWLPRSYFVAASVAVLLLTVGYLTRMYWDRRTIATEYGEVRSIVLDDGSRVTLNANSAIQIPRFSFGYPSREVFLQGEAEFVIVHTAANDRFRVHTANEVEVVVLGTEFVVNTRRNNTRVVLNRGKVQLRYTASDKLNTLMMKPGDCVNLATNKQPRWEHQSVDPNTAAAWKNYQYTFRQTPMPEIATLLSDNFGLTVELDQALAQRNVTGTFHAQSADELLQALVELFDFTVIRQGKTIKLTLSNPVSTQTKPSSL